MSLFRSFLSFLKIHPVKLLRTAFGGFNRVKKWPSKLQWRQFFKVLTKKEKIAFLVFLFLILFSSLSLFFIFYFKNTEVKPVRGGIYTEGVVGQPRFINPIYANSDVDRDLVQLIFSGLMKYDKDLNIIPDLVEKYDVEEDGRVYKFYLKENLFWQNKTPLTADDVIFTIKTIQNPDYKSPIRANWVGVEVEKISDLGIKFSLKQPYSSFLENSTVKILPKYIWDNITPENFPFEIYNLKPIGSGPYKLKEIKQDKKGQIESLILTPNPFYFNKEPYISEIKFLFFNSEEELIKAAKSGKVKGLSLSYYKNMGKDWKVYYLSLPRYFAVFFNQNKSKVLADEKVRTALNYGTNKEEIIKEVLGLPEDLKIIETKIVNSPILPEIYNFNQPSINYSFDPEKAKNILEDAGYKDDNNDGLREKTIKKEPAFQFKSDLKPGSRGKEVQELQKCLSNIFPDILSESEINNYFGDKTKEMVIKFQEKHADEILKPKDLTKGTGSVDKNTRNKLNEVCFGNPIDNIPLRFSLVTVDQPQLAKVANLLKQQWEKIGVKIEIEKVPLARLEDDFIKPRNYDSLLFGEVLGAIPDLFPFWHSSQKKDPGLNLALYENKEADKLLEEARKSLNSDLRAEKLNLFQNILIKDPPAVFLYSPDFIYFTSKEVSGININKITDPSKRFTDIENWYTKTKRLWK